MSEKYSDLKLIDELLMDLKDAIGAKGWGEVERHSTVTQQAIQRLREARKTDEMPLLTMSLARYFGEFG